MVLPFFRQYSNTPVLQYSGRLSRGTKGETKRAEKSIMVQNDFHHPAIDLPASAQKWKSGGELKNRAWF